MSLITMPYFSCGNGQQQVSSPFEYRDVHLPRLSVDEEKKLQLNSVDRDWGIWGHNIAVVLPKNPAPSIYSKTGNSTNREQFCFSSDMLFKYIKDFIDDSYGRNGTVRFAILPNDNSIVCQCEECKEHGNTQDDASGAVYYMIERLSREYPQHIFFTSFYRTTRSLPSHPLPDNAGVLVSAMLYPLSQVETAQEKEFIRILRDWAKVTRRLYVWDYINNFDDYLTPFPIFDVFQRRFRLYEDAGVTGVFLNGSGEDYSTMSRIKTHVLAALMSDPNVDWRSELRDVCDRLYPVAGRAICDFMIRQEQMVKDKGRVLPIYEGVLAASKIYLPADEFIRFHDELINAIPYIKDPERTEVQMMIRAMMFTRLELQRIGADTTGCARLIDGLERVSRQGIVTYSESGGSIESYIAEYRGMLSHAKETGSHNLLKGVKLEPLTSLDEDYSDISILTDGLLGLPSSYHCGQMLSSASPALRISVPYVRGIRRIRVNLTKNLIYHIDLPLSVTLSAGGREIARKVPKPLAENPRRAVLEFDVPSGVRGGSLVLTIERNQDERTMALDEIEGLR